MPFNGIRGNIYHTSNLKEKKEAVMNEKDSVYKFIELVGTSKNSWEEAAKNAVERASKSIRDTRVAEIKDLDMRLDNGKVLLYRATVRLSFKYEESN